MSALREQKACRSCKAPITWAFTPRGAKIPLDPESEVPAEHRSHAYVIEMLLVAGDLPNTRKFDPAIDKVGRISHFRSCPGVAEFSKTSRR
jgi:hypothetical protein